MTRLTINSNTHGIIKNVSIETTTILGWTVGSALHSIFTKKSLNRLNENESIISRIAYGSFLTVIQLFIAALTGVLICGIANIKIKKRHQVREPTEYNHTLDNSIFDGTVTESTCENKTEQFNGTQMSLCSSYTLNKWGSNVNGILECSEETIEISDLTNDENSDVIFRSMNKSYNQSTFSRNIENTVELKIDNEVLKKEASICEELNVSDEKIIKFDSKKKWWGTKELLFSAVLYAIANICANTALGGGKVMLVQIIKCSELILTAILAFLIQKRRITIRELVSFSISTAGIVLVVTSTLTGKATPSKALIYSVLLASIGALTISLRNVIISSSSKNEKAIDTFTILSSWGMISSLLIFAMSLFFGKFTLNVPILPLIISGFFHATYNFSSLAFLKLVGSPVVHAYFNLAKRAIIVLTAELINCTSPPPVQIIGSILAILGIHFSKKSNTKQKCVNLKYLFYRFKTGKESDSALQNTDMEHIVENTNKDKYPYAASVGISGLIIAIGWIMSYTCSCMIPTNNTKSLVSLNFKKIALLYYFNLELIITRIKITRVLKC